MYDKESVARRINDIGVRPFVRDISSDDFSKEIAKDLEEIHILRNGYPCLSVISLLAN